MDLWCSNIHHLEDGSGAHRVIDGRSKLTLLDKGVADMERRRKTRMLGPSAK